MNTPIPVRSPTQRLSAHIEPVTGRPRSESGAGLPGVRSRANGPARHSLVGRMQWPQNALRQTFGLSSAGRLLCHGHDAKWRPLIRWPMAKFGTDIQMALMSLRLAPHDRICESLPTKTAVARRPRVNRRRQKLLPLSVAHGRPAFTQRSIFPGVALDRNARRRPSKRIVVDGFDPVAMVHAPETLRT